MDISYLVTGVHQRDLSYHELCLALKPEEGESLGESQRLEYKSQYNPHNKSERPGLAKSIAGLANSTGGIIVVGVLERDQRVESFPGIPLGGDTDTLHRVVNGLLSPIPEKHIQELPNPDDPKKGLLVITVPPSEYGPHALHEDKEAKFPIRKGPTTEFMGEAEIARAYQGRFASLLRADDGLESLRALAARNHTWGRLSVLGVPLSTSRRGYSGPADAYAKAQSLMYQLQNYGFEVSKSRTASGRVEIGSADPSALDVVVMRRDGGIAIAVEPGFDVSESLDGTRIYTLHDAALRSYISMVLLAFRSTVDTLDLWGTYKIQMGFHITGSTAYKIGLHRKLMDEDVQLDWTIDVHSLHDEGALETLIAESYDEIRSSADFPVRTQLPPNGKLDERFLDGVWRTVRQDLS